MAVRALIVGHGSERLWNLDAHERLRRQLHTAGIVTASDARDEGSGDAPVLIINAGFLFEVRTLRALAGECGAALLTADDALAAVCVMPSGALSAAAAVATGGALPPGLRRLHAEDLDAYDRQLRKAEPPLVERVHGGNRDALENLLYGNAYKGITDLVTKWVWPRPARAVTRLCAASGVTPNMVTLTGLALVIAAGVAFHAGHHALGLACGWLMTLLDTVDGKLARVTVSSSRFGHWLDHGMDIVHPPIWYVLWGMGLDQYTPHFGLELRDLYWLIVGGYLAGRAIEAAFHALCHCGLFAWRPFDAYFRLVTARRNPCLIVLTVLLPLAGADAALFGVAAWTVLTSAVLALRLIYAAWVRWRSGPLDSWLKDPARAARDHPRTYRLFSATRGAYG
jgi:phosphatidylglycerophosphate synthase